MPLHLLSKSPFLLIKLFTLSILSLLLPSRLYLLLSITRLSLHLIIFLFCLRRLFHSCLILRCLLSVSVDYNLSVSLSSSVILPTLDSSLTLLLISMTLSTLTTPLYPLFSTNQNYPCQNSQPWFALAKLKSARRHLEKIWLQNRCLQDFQPLRRPTANNA